LTDPVPESLFYQTPGKAIQTAAAVTSHISHVQARRNSAAIRDQHEADLQARSLTRGGLFTGRGRHFGAFEN